MIYDVCIIGGGAAGMTAAAAAAWTGAHVLIIEHGHRLGKKILSTGNGKCNLTNRLMTSECFRSSHMEFVSHVLETFSTADSLKLFNRLGTAVTERNGYYYPQSEQAAVVNTLFEAALAEASVDIRLDCHIQRIHKNGDRFDICTETDIIKSRKLIMAAGGLSAPKTGSDGSAFSFCKAFGHHLVPMVPALCGLRCSDRFFKALAGVRVKGTVSLYIDQAVTASDTGELQLTAYGISGIPAFQISRFAAYALAAHQQVEVCMDLLPDMTQKDIQTFLMQQHYQYPGRSLNLVLNGLLNTKLCGVLTGLAGTQQAKTAIRKISEYIKHFPAHVTAVNDYEQAQVTAGGIELSEVNADTMESLLVKGLYFAGEMMDVDGICGGYNLQWAWSTGYIAGTYAGKE